LGISYRVMLDDFLVKEKRAMMHNNAQAMVNLAAAYDATGELDNPWGGFRLGLASAAQVADTEVLFADLQGQVRMCSCEAIGCYHSDWTIDPELISRTMAFGEEFEQSTVGDLYEKIQLWKPWLWNPRWTGRSSAAFWSRRPGDRLPVW